MEISTTSGFFISINSIIDSVGMDVPILNTLNPLIVRYVSKTSHPM